MLLSSQAKSEGKSSCSKHYDRTSRRSKGNEAGSTNKPNLEELLLLVRIAIQILNLELEALEHHSKDGW